MVSKNTSNFGKLMVIVGILILAPIIVIPFYQKEIAYIPSFFIPGSISVFLGILLIRLRNKNDEEYSFKHSMFVSSVTVVLAWAYGYLLGALPFVLGNQLTFVQALFESISGWTTTGLSVMDVSITPKIFLFHRAFMQYCGGLGFVMMMTMIVQQKTAMNLYYSEGHPDKLEPSLRKTARIIFLMYFGFLIIGTIMYIMVGMEVFDSILHTMCALSTGGFSTKLNNIGEYNNFAIELVSIVLMLIGTTNFGVLLLLVKGKFKQAFKVSEFKFMFLILAISIPLVGINLANAMQMGLLKGIRHALFDTVTALSTTGFSSMSYSNWPEFSIFIMTLLMLIGGGVGSTAGGIKMERVVILIKATIRNIKTRLLPPRAVTVESYVKATGKEYIDNTLEQNNNGFIAFYLFLYVIGVLLLTLTANCTLAEAMFEFSSAIGTVGISIGITNPLTNNATLIVEMIGMALGRLEIFVVLTAIYSSFKVLKVKYSNLFKKKTSIISK